MQMGKHKDFREKLRDLINEHSMESGSDTPDYVLARFLDDSLKAFDRAVNDREAAKTPAITSGYLWTRADGKTRITNVSTHAGDYFGTSVTQIDPDVPMTLTGTE